MSSSIPAAARRYLAAPDAVIPLDGPPRPLPLAVSVATGLAGMGAFGAVVGLGLRSAGWGADLLSMALIPPLVAALCFPPLLLIAALQGRAPGVLAVAGVAASGPTVAGAALGASAPLALLYVLTGSVDAAFALLSLGMAGMAWIAGAWGALANARRAGPAAPGPLTVLLHYTFTAWTALVLAVHFA